MADNPIGALILEARKKASRTSGQPAIAYARECTCSVEVAYFTPRSNRENYSRCVLHKIR